MAQFAMYKKDIVTFGMITQHLTTDGDITSGVHQPSYWEVVSLRILN